jgi:hypothetical protein
VEGSQQRNAHPENESPPPPALAQAIATLVDSQTELMRMIAANNSCQGGQAANHTQHQDASFAEFLATHPPIFTEAVDPLEAAHWLRTIEAKFELLRCNEQQKTLDAAQQLHGSAGAWWATYSASPPRVI